jgi:hypothetical protein
MTSNLLRDSVNFRSALEDALTRGLRIEASGELVGVSDVGYDGSASAPLERLCAKYGIRVHGFVGLTDNKESHHPEHLALVQFGNAGVETAAVQVTCVEGVWRRVTGFDDLEQLKAIRIRLDTPGLLHKALALPCRDAYTLLVRTRAELREEAKDARAALACARADPQGKLANALQNPKVAATIAKFRAMQNNVAGLT